MVVKIRLIVGLIILTLLVTACAGIPARPTATPEPTVESMDSMTGDSMAEMGSSLSTNDYAPLVTAFYEGEEMLFIHTEASDPDVATMLTEMMDGPLVVLVPELAEAPESLLANMYAFTNGLEGHGPFGFQPDIFDAVPGDEAYRPLRAVNLVAWSEGVEARELRFVAELKAAEEKGEVTVTRPGIVVNMPVLVWPGGSRANSTAMVQMDSMGGMGSSLLTDDYAPLVTAFYEGEEMLFIHTEASDPDVATMLTEMMGGPLVVLAPQLAEAPESLLANMYAFTNGLEGHGPFGFQPDIFDAVPSDEGYRPLRTVNLVAWNEGADVQALRSLAELKAAEEKGEVTITRPGIVVNMPVLVWPGGTR